MAFFCLTGSKEVTFLAPYFNGVKPKPCLKVTVRAGDVLRIPAHWTHYVFTSGGESINYLENGRYVRK